MTEGGDILARILAEPADDTVRLVYADWLQEHGDETLAAYIRAAISYPLRSAFPEGTPAVVFLAPPVGESLIIAPAHPGVAWTVHRGFVDELRCSAATWIQFGDAIRREHPVRQVALTTIPGIEERTAIDPRAPVGWCVGYSIRAGKWCSWDTLGRPTIDPRDERSLAKVLLEAESPGVTFDVPKTGRVVPITMATILHSAFPVMGNPGGANYVAAQLDLKAFEEKLRGPRE